MAVALQADEVQVAGLLQVHLATLDDGLQMALLDAECRRLWHQRLHNGVAGLTGKRFGHFGLPPGQFGLGHAGVHHVVNHVIDFAAKGIKRGDGCTFGGGQEQKGVVEAAARGGGLLLDVLRRGHSAKD